MYSITTGLSVDLMDRFDAYRANSVSLVSASAFPEDVAIFLRQQIHKDIEATIDLIAKNPRSAAPLITPVAPELPEFTIPNEPVFAPDPVVVEPQPAA